MSNRKKTSNITTYVFSRKEDYMKNLDLNAWCVCMQELKINSKKRKDRTEIINETVSNKAE